MTRGWCRRNGRVLKPNTNFFLTTKMQRKFYCPSHGIEGVSCRVVDIRLTNVRSRVSTRSQAPQARLRSEGGKTRSPPSVEALATSTRSVANWSMQGIYSFIELQGVSRSTGGPFKLREICTCASLKRVRKKETASKTTPTDL